MNPCRCVQRGVRRAGEVGPDVGAVDRLLAGDPAAPRHRPAGAVHLGAVEAGVGRGRPRRSRVTSTVVVPPRAIGVVGLARAERRAGVVDLVVADQHDVARRPAPERGHAVVAARAGSCRRRARPGSRCRGTSGTGTPRAATAGPRRRAGRGSPAGRGRMAAAGGRRQLDEAPERSAQGDHPGRRGGSTQEFPPIHRTHRQRSSCCGLGNHDDTAGRQRLNTVVGPSDRGDRGRAVGLRRRVVGRPQNPLLYGGP